MEDKIEGTEVEYINPDKVIIKDCYVAKYDSKIGGTIMGEIVSSPSKHNIGKVVKCLCIKATDSQYEAKHAWFLKAVKKGVIDGNEFDKIFYPETRRFILSNEPSCAFE